MPIIKVQLSIATNAGSRQMLIYDQHRKHFYEGDATPEIIEMLQPANGEYHFMKAYFHADLIPDPQPGRPKAFKFLITKWADPQGW